MGDPPADLPEHVSDWYQSATMVVEVLAECLEPVRDTLGEFPYRKVERAMAALSRADKLIERMRRQLERGRDMAAGRYAVADGYGTTTIQ